MQKAFLSSAVLLIVFAMSFSSVNCDQPDITLEKRQSLIPFPRVGRSRPGLSKILFPNGRAMTYQWDDLTEIKRHLIPFPRVGKRQRLIPFPRVGRAFSLAADYEETDNQEHVSDDYPGNNPYPAERRKRSSGQEQYQPDENGQFWLNFQKNSKAIQRPGSFDHEIAAGESAGEAL